MAGDIARDADSYGQRHGLPAGVGANISIARVTTDDQGRLTPDSTVTVGGQTWPVPERTERGGDRDAPRISDALRERGYWLAGNQWEPGDRPGVYEVPCEYVDDSEED
jgi:hypothetical protein